MNPFQYEHSIKVAQEQQRRHELYNKHFLLHYDKPNPLPSIRAEVIDSLNWL